MWRLGLLCALCPAAASAGPWLREEGSTYLSFSAEIAEYDDVEGYLSVYAEHGLTPDLTVGIDAGGAHDAQSAKALAFARLPIARGGTWRLAAQIGAGALLDDGEVIPVLRPGLSAGRGLDLWQGGWWAVDLSANVTGRDVAAFDLDAVMGLRPSSTSAILLGLRGSDEGIRLVPGYERAFGPAAIALSAVLDPEGDAPAALSLRTAFEF